MSGAKTILKAEEAQALVQSIKAAVTAAVYGQEDLVDEVLAAFLAGGHILLTGAPGLAKTTLVRAFAQHLELRFGRVQFTPDLMPSDIVGAEILNVDPLSQKRQFDFVPGPVFCNLLLADEINRASPRTQSALLEAMQERTVTVANQTHKLPEPFMVLATQNPFETEGTFPLPEAQLDRFLCHSLVDYPPPEAELQILKSHLGQKLFGEKEATVTGDAQKPQAEDLAALRLYTSQITVDPVLLGMVRDFVRATRPSDPSCPEQLRGYVQFGAGPRAGLSLLSAARSFAVIDGQKELRWRHLRRLIKPVLRHRLGLNHQALRAQKTPDLWIQELLDYFEAKHQSLVS